MVVLMVRNADGRFVTQESKDGFLYTYLVKVTLVIQFIMMMLTRLLEDWNSALVSLKQRTGTMSFTCQGVSAGLRHLE